MNFQIDNTTTNQEVLVFDHRPRGPLSRLQHRWQRGRLWRLGNVVSDIRYVLWRAIR